MGKWYRVRVRVRDRARAREHSSSFLFFLFFTSKFAYVVTICNFKFVTNSVPYDHQTPVTHHTQLTRNRKLILCGQR